MSAAMTKEMSLTMTDIAAMVESGNTTEAIFTIANLQASVVNLQHERDELRARLEAAEKDALTWKRLGNRLAEHMKLHHPLTQHCSKCASLIEDYENVLSPTDAGVMARGGGE